MMRVFATVFVMLLVAAPLAAQQTKSAKEGKASSAPPKVAKNSKATKAGAAKHTDPASYAIGQNIGRQLKAQGVAVNGDLVARGILDILAEKEAMYDEEETSSALDQFEQEVSKRIDEQVRELAEKNKKEGAEFLAANKKKKGVTTLPSGLQYQVLTKGTGATPKPTDQVTTHYHGTFIDGTVFDSSVERKEPVTFPVDRVIKGWSEALQKMKVGDKWRLFVPAELAYSERGSPPDIGPNATLVFEVELLEIAEKIERAERVERIEKTGTSERARK